MIYGQELHSILFDIEIIFIDTENDLKSNKFI